ncbi:MAG: hypothetical protein NC177_04950 [Ruminococcus flavefaciens]|nr:hypothetical protein [Ruminococcus flavefaciens]
MIAEFSNPPSKRIYILIELLEETEISNKKYNSITFSNSKAENDNAIQNLLYNAIETLSEKSGMTSHDIERTLNDVVVNDDMRLNIVHFCNNINDWLITGDKKILKEVLIKNISDKNHDSDLQAIENWYTSE